MAKRDNDGYLRGEGPYSKSDDMKFSRPPVVGESGSKSKDRSKAVDDNAERNGGFSASLTSPED